MCNNIDILKTSVEQQYPLGYEHITPQGTKCIYVKAGKDIPVGACLKDDLENNNVQ